LESKQPNYRFMFRYVTGCGLPKLARVSKGKAIPLQAWTRLKVPRRLRFPDFKTIGT
jgi:hypothetical protein